MVTLIATLEEVKSFFNFDEEEDEAFEEFLQYLIEHYSEVIIDKTDITEVSIKAKEALMLAIGCHLTKIHLDKIFPTISYTVGDVRERLQAPNNAEASYCQQYKEKIAEIIYDMSTTFAIYGEKRKGLSDEF